MSIFRGSGSGISGTALETIQSYINAAEAAQTAALAAQAAAEAAQTAAEAAQALAEAAQTAAELAETNAETAETNAEAAQVAAEAAQTAAEAAQTAAELAETNAETAETNAETAETNAEAAQLAAENARDAALAAQTAAEAAYDSFDDRYLGSKAADPTLDNDGNALLEGAIYWNSTSNELRTYNGATWDAWPNGYMPKSGGTFTGDITFGYDDARIYAPMGEGTTVSDNLTFIPTETNADARLQIAPSGSGGSASLRSYGKNDVENSPYGFFYCHGTNGVIFGANKTGSASAPPILIQTGSTTRLTISETGTVTWAQAVGHAAGSAGTPSISFSGDTNTGLYSAAADELGVSVGGSNVGTFSSTGLETPMVVTASPLSYRNKIINGEMLVDQRGSTSYAISATGIYTVDRWAASESGDGLFTVSKDASVIPDGFLTSLKFITTTADASLGATQFNTIYQPIEGLTMMDAKFGTASAENLTLSFWVRSSITGTHSGSIRNSASNRSYPFTYTISVANTWEYKTILIPGDTSGTWLKDTGIGVMLSFDMGTGSTYRGTAGSWASTNYVGATGAVSPISTLNATWYITGVQLEIGDVATPFERIPLQFELIRCMRYFQKVSDLLPNGYAAAGNLIYQHVPLPVFMRATPTTTVSGTAYSNGSSFSVATVSFKYLRVNFTVTATGTGWGAGTVDLDAEL